MWDHARQRGGYPRRPLSSAPSTACPLLGLDDGGHAGGVGLPPDVFGVGKFVVFFVLHPSVLEPNFDLSF